MLKSASIIAIAALVTLGSAWSAYAQTTTATTSAGTTSAGTTGTTGTTGTGMMSTMPFLYDSSGRAVNTGSGSLAAGYYYLQPGAQQQVYYYGNGTYYNAATGEYGGSVNNPTGMAGANLGYTTGTGVTPGVPATGFGGQALATWLTLALSGIIALGGSAYLALNRRAS